MKKATFKIRRNIITAFLCCFLSVLVFASAALQTHREIGYRLGLVEVADDLVNHILELRCFEKNQLLHKQPGSLSEALSHVNRVEELYRKNEQDILGTGKAGERSTFLSALDRYRNAIAGIHSTYDGLPNSSPTPAMSLPKDTLRSAGQDLLDVATAWAAEERSQIDTLFHKAFYLFVNSMLFFGVLGIAAALFISVRLTAPLIEMQKAMDKIAHGDFTPIPEPGRHSEEFAPLFKAFNRMITELEERQEQLVQARKISAIGTFTSGIAHELNNPVNNIVLTAEALKDDWGNLDHEEALGMIQDIISQSERASEIIRNLLDFSRSERPEYVSVSLPSVIEDTLKLVRNQLLLSHVEEDFRFSQPLPSVCGDYRSLQQVFLNLFVNAIHAMPRGGRLEVRACSVEDGNWVKVEVADTGEGIDTLHLPHIFDPFFTTKEVGKGTGLGLSVTYGIVQKHGGRIEVDSRPGSGAVFTIMLPTETGATGENR